MPDHAMPKVPVAIFSLEMGAMQLVLRMLCAEAKVDMQRARKGQMNDEEWRRMSMTIGRLSEAPIFIDDTPAITPLEIRAKARRLKAAAQYRPGHRRLLATYERRKVDGIARERNFDDLPVAQSAWRKN